VKNKKEESKNEAIKGHIETGEYHNWGGRRRLNENSQLIMQNLQVPFLSRLLLDEGLERDVDTRLHTEMPRQ
jgi:hypothetical protein